MIKILLKIISNTILYISNTISVNAIEIFNLYSPIKDVIQNKENLLHLEIWRLLHGKVYCITFKCPYTCSVHYRFMFVTP